MSSYNPEMKKINILLLDNDFNSLVRTADLLLSYSYHVKAFQEPSSAVSALSDGIQKFDLLMADIDLSDAEAYEVFYEAQKKGLVIIMMSDTTIHFQEKNAIETGAYLCHKKPISMYVAMYLWQDVYREKMRKKKEEGNATMATKLKACIEWTPELHKKFKDAVNLLGEGRCFPNDILEVMKVPGLTRQHVASHLQKCRIAARASSSNGTKKYGVLPQETLRSQPETTKNKYLNGNQVQVDVQSDATLSIPISRNNDNDNFGGKEIAGEMNKQSQLFDSIPFNIEMNGDRVVTGINFNPQDINWDKVDPEQVPKMDNGVADHEKFWSSWLEGFVKYQGLDIDEGLGFEY